MSFLDDCLERNKDWKAEPLMSMFRFPTCVSGSCLNELRDSFVEPRLSEDAILNELLGVGTFELVSCVSLSWLLLLRRFKQLAIFSLLFGFKDVCWIRFMTSLGL